MIRSFNMGNSRLKPFSQLLLPDLSNHHGRISYHNCIRWNITGDNCPSTHHGILAYLYPGKRIAPPPYPHIVLDHDRFGYFLALDSGLRLKIMGGGIDLNGRSDHDMVANPHLIVIQNGAHVI